MNALRVLAPLLMTALACSGCAERFAIVQTTLAPGADADVTVVGEHAELEIRNTGDWIADLKIEAHRGVGKDQIKSPPLPLPPEATWKIRFDDLVHVERSGPADEPGVILWIRNQGDRAAKLQFWAPRWTTLTINAFPNGREARPITPIVDEPGADGVKREVR